MRRAQMISMIRPKAWCGRTFWFILLAMGLMLSGALATGVIVVGQHFSLAMGAAALGLAVVSAAAASRSITRPFHRLMATLKQAQTDLDQAYVQFVETMAQALDARDPYTAGHSVRVAAYSYAIAREMGLPEEQAETIRIAGQLHDIGKIGIPDVILQKSGKLTPEEFGLVKLHPQIGRKILEKVGRFEKLLAPVELHHENHDGTGYPYGLAGDRIPIETRILHVADCFDAMTTSRAYRPALPLRRAIGELEMNSGTQFDPTVVAVFLKMIADGQQNDILMTADSRLLESERAMEMRMAQN